MTAPFTLIADGRAVGVQATVDADRVFVPPAEVRDALGWEYKPEGLCRGDICIPVRDTESLVMPEGLELRSLAAALGRPLALDAAAGAAALAEAATDRSAALASLEAPDFSLPDLAGRMHSLSDHRGKKVLLVAYASW